ncbi:MAG: hypothetical protein WC867_01325 [Candidatus Pacearchaeota archaeon]|jgi:hypothetical protein
MTNNSSGCLGKLIEAAAIVGIVYSLCNYFKEDKPVQNRTLLPSFNRQIEQKDFYQTPKKLWDNVKSSFPQNNTSYSTDRDYRSNPLSDQEMRNNAPVFHY